jgi:hypothetical protein
LPEGVGSDLEHLLDAPEQDDIVAVNLKKITKQ